MPVVRPNCRTRCASVPASPQACQSKGRTSTPGHVVFVNHAARFALVGDVLFQGSIGRTDFPYGDHAALIRAIAEKLLPLGDDFAFLCGHGPSSTIGAERRSNPFLR